MQSSGSHVCPVRPNRLTLPGAGMPGVGPDDRRPRPANWGLLRVLTVIPWQKDTQNISRISEEVSLTGSANVSRNPGRTVQPPSAQNASYPEKVLSDHA